MEPNQNVVNQPSAQSMQPVQNIQSVQESKPATSAQDGKDIVFQDKPKKKTGPVLGMMLLVILALGGVGFGVWEMMDGNTQKDALNQQISALKKQNSELQEKIDNDHNNPTIKSTDSDEKNALWFYSSNVYWDGSGNHKNLVIEIDESQNISCQIRLNGVPSEDCVISGLEGNVYKIVEFGSGQDNYENNVGFIMTDGTVKYLPLHNSVLNNNFSIRGSVILDGYVVDAFDVAVSPTSSSVGGHNATVFVFRDGSYKKFDKSMLK